MSNEVLFEMEGNFRKGFPDIKTPPDIEENLASVPMSEKVFVTMPIMPVGARSRNGRTYDDAVVRELVRQINDERPAGNYGHIPTDKRATHHEPAAIRWIAAEIVDGVAWGKALATRDDAVKDITWAMRTNAKLGTSIYGTAEMDGGKVKGLVLESIDFAAPSRIGVQEAAARPNVTAEMTDEKGKPDMETIAEITGQRDQLQEQVTTLAARVTELSVHSGIVAELRSMFGADANIVAEVTGLRGQVAEMAAAKTKHDIDVLIDTLVPVAEMRDTVREIAGGAATVDAAKSKIDAYMATPGYTRLAQALVSEQAGGAALVGAGADVRKAKADAMVEAAKKFAENRG